jgi:hypothetical protein
VLLNRGTANDPGLVRPDLQHRGPAVRQFDTHDLRQVPGTEQHGPKAGPEQLLANASQRQIIEHAISVP